MNTSVFDRFDGLSIGVLGDFCVDIYWDADMRESRLSRETPLFPYPIHRETFSPGAAGNVAANLAALRPGRVAVCAVVGDDWRGELLRRALTERCIDASGLIVEEGRFTNAYCKPILHGISDTVYEASRLDFENRRPPAPASEERVLAWLEETAPRLDALCVCDQFVGGTVTPRVRAAVSALAQGGLTVICDSRENAPLFRDVIVKPNEIECLRAVGLDDTNPEEDTILSAARTLAKNSGNRVLVTMGHRGSAFTDGDSLLRVPACPVKPPLDICGAGDTFLSAFTLSYAAGNGAEASMALAARASAVTIKKLGMTGTASREELLS